MYKLKQLPEDFQVAEQNSLLLQDHGSYAYFKVKKVDLDTLTVVQRIAKQLNLREKQIGFAGNKDKSAVTEQVMSVKGISAKTISNLRIPKASISFLGYGHEPITLGALAGNKFTIVIRNLTQEKLTKPAFFENYFDEQRFSGDNCAIGRALVKKEFKQAVANIDLQQINRDQQYQNHRLKHPTDYIGALQRIPLRLLRLYVHAYQSYLWNETVKRYLEKKCFNFKLVNYSLGQFLFSQQPIINLQIPLLGFARPPVHDSVLEAVIIDLMRQENVNETDFIIKSLPQVSVEGEWRQVFCEVNGLAIDELKKDELNSGRKKVTVTFSLPKGSYATMLVRKIFS